MEQLSRERLEGLKADAAARIAEGIKSQMALVDKTDKLCGKGKHRLREYLADLQNGERHNVYEQLAGARFFELLARYTFKPSRVARLVILFESLPMPSSKGREYSECTACEMFQFASIYGFYKENGVRLVTEALLFVPRKYGKTTLCAVLALEDVLFGDCDAEAYISSNQFQQSQICFKAISKMLRMLDAGHGHFKFRRDTIDVSLPKRESLIRCLPYSPDKLDGLKASIGIYDELAQADSFDQKNVIASSMGTRAAPLLVDITTASAKTETPFVEELEAFKKILRGEAKGDNVFAHIFQPDLGDDESKESTWRKVHPHYDVTLNPRFYPEQWEAAQRGYDNMVEFRTKLLNTFVYGEQKSWYDARVIHALMQPFTLEELRAKVGTLYGVAAVDLSVSGDLSAVTYMIYDEVGLHFYSKTKYYLPEQSVKGSNAQLYREWADKGYLTLMEGSAIDPVKIAEDIVKDGDYMVICKVGYDPYKSKDLCNTLIAYGAEKALLAVRQSISHFTAPVGKMGLLIDRAAITFDENPITAWCFQNAILMEDTNGNVKPMKRNNDSPMKIDGAITNLMALIALGECGIG